jgi:endonuclease YncB( thermonuclease family)
MVKMSYTLLLIAVCLFLALIFTDVLGRADAQTTVPLRRTIDNITVVDGDTFALGAVKFRLWGVDAPELTEPGGPEAKIALTLIGEMLEDISCNPRGTSFERVVARCRAVIDVARLMLALGHATENVKFSDGFYGDQQTFSARSTQIKKTAK